MADHELENRDLTVGRSLYGGNCASCHGANLEGQPNWQSANKDGVLP
ncbi:MAG TPA: cytochrome C, partial [Rhodobacteraceae bacterium]|nr:cytochrome C [Paracoccaceae bacterium]